VGRSGLTGTGWPLNLCFGLLVTEAQRLCFRRLSPKLFFLEAATTKKGEEQKARSSCLLQATGYRLQATAQGLRQNAKGTKEKYLELMQKSNGCVNSQSIFTFERNRMQLFGPTSLPLTLPNYVACWDRNLHFNSKNYTCPPPPCKSLFVPNSIDICHSDHDKRFCCVYLTAWAP